MPDPKRRTIVKRACREIGRIPAIGENGADIGIEELLNVLHVPLNALRKV